MFGVQAFASAIVVSSSYSLGPIIPPACSAMADNTLADGSSFTLQNEKKAQQAFQTGAGHTAIAMAVHVLDTYTLGSQVFVDYFDGGTAGVFVAPLSSFSMPSSIALQVYNDGGSQVAFWGSSTAPQMQLLSCQPSAFTPQGGSV